MIVRMKCTKRLYELLTVVGMLMCSAPMLAQNSEVCEKNLQDGSDVSTLAYLTCETDSAGRVLISIKAADGAEASTTFRANGLAAAGFKYNGEEMGDYFDRSPANVGNAKTIIYTPRAEAEVAYGGQITYNRYREGQYTEWKTAGNGNCYTTSFSFTYTYGSVCSGLATPVLTGMAGDVPQFEAVTGAQNYIVRVYKGGKLFHEQTINHGGAITFQAATAGTYQVTVQAHSTSMLDSDESNSVDWTVAAANLPVGGSEYCHATLGSGAFMDWVTLDNGNVQISVYGDEGTTWRNNALGAGLGNFTIGGVPASLFFKRVHSGGSNTYTLQLKDPTVRPAQGLKIVFYGTVEWKTLSNTNAYNTLRFNYTYGSSCGQLATPVITSLSPEGVLTFNPVDGASSYEARVYFNGVLKHFQTISSGQTINYVADETGTYQVTLIANSPNALPSEESASVDWALVAPDIEVGPSEICTKVTSSGNKKCYLTAQTLENGDVEIEISGDDGTNFRGNGLGSGLSGFSIGSIPASQYFERRYDGDKSITYTLHLKDPNIRPSRGAKIRYSGTMEWRTSQNTNAYETITFNYTYGSVCPSLDQPTIQSISNEGVVTFAEEIAGAASYTVKVYRGELLVHTQSMQNGGTLTFHPLITYRYTVYAQAVAGPGVVSSQMSDPYLWRYAAQDMDLPMSSLCDKNISGNDGGVTLTAETDSLGVIVFTLRGGAHATWRAQGINLNNMKVCGQSVDNYFNKLGGYEKDTVMYLVPKSNAIITGDVLTHSGPIEWYYESAAGTFIDRWVEYAFTYVYGTDCNPVTTRLEAPRDVQINAVGEIQFSEVENANRYQVKVTDAANDVMSVQPIVSHDTVDRELSILSDFHYLVAVRALPQDASRFRPSLWSEDVEWVPSYVAVVYPNDDEENDDDDTRPEDETGGYPTVTFPDDTALEDVVLDVPVAKIILRGQVYIYRAGHIFTILGQLIH